MFMHTREKSLGLAFATGLWLLGSTAAYAQEAAPQSVAPVVIEASPDSQRPSPEALYDQAFAALASGDRALAARHLQQLVLDYPDHAVTAKARPLLESLATAPSTRAEAAPPVPSAPPAPSTPDTRSAPAPGAWQAGANDHDQAPTSAARAELIFFQTLHGFVLGTEVCTIAECDEIQPWVATMMLGAGLGFGASFALSMDGVTPGLARALTNGALWGAAHGIEVYVGAELEVGVDEELRLAGSLALGQLSGMGAAGLLYASLHPTPGQVSVTSSGGIWAGVLTTEMLGILQPDSSGGAIGWLFMATTDVGLVAGGVLASHEPMSVSRVLMIDAGGVVGTLVGLGLGVLVAREDEFGDPDLSMMSTFGLIGTLTGLGSAYHLTHEWDRDDTSATNEGNTPQLALIPSRDGASMTLSGQW